MKLSEFQLKHQDGENYHITHPSGKTLVIHKKSLSYPAQRAIEKMACGGTAMAEGGAVGNAIDTAKKFLSPDFYAAEQAKNAKVDTYMPQDQPANQSQPKKMASGGQVHGQGHALKGGTSHFDSSKMYQPQVKPVQHFDDGGTAQDITRFDPNAPFIPGGPDYNQQYQNRVQENLQPQMVPTGAMRAEFGPGPQPMSPENAQHQALADTAQQQKMDLSQDAARKQQTAQELKGKYQSDLNEWNQKQALGIDPGPMPQAPPESDLPIQSQPIGNEPVEQMQAQPNPFGQSNTDMNALLNKRQLETQQFTDAQLKALQGSNAAYNNYVKQTNALPTPQDMYNQFTKQDHDLATAFMSKTVDPQKFQHDMSTKSRVLSGISMIFGGLGMGLGQKTNPGVDWLNKAIDNDIEKQKNEQGKSMTLWKMNRDAYGNEVQANLATRNQMLTGLQAQIAHAAAAAQSPLIKYRGQQSINDFEQQKIMNRQRMTMMSQGQGQGGVSQMDPLLLANDPNIVPPEMRKSYTSELGKVQYVANNKQRLLDMYDQMEQQKKLGPSMLRGFQEAPSEANITNNMMPLIKDADGRPDEYKMNEMKKLLPGTFEYKSTGETHRQGFSDFIDNLADAPTAKSLGIHPENFASTSLNPANRLSQQERQYYNYAKANPSAPVSQAFFKKHPGLK